MKKNYFAAVLMLAASYLHAADPIKIQALEKYLMKNESIGIAYGSHTSRFEGPHLMEEISLSIKVLNGRKTLMIKQELWNEGDSNKDLVTCEYKADKSGTIDGILDSAHEGTTSVDLKSKTTREKYQGICDALIDKMEREIFTLNPKKCQPTN